MNTSKELKLIAEHHLILKAGFCWAAMLKDSSDIRPIIRHNLKLSFNQYWLHSRKLTLEYNKACEFADVDDVTQDSEALLVEYLSEFFNSMNPKTLVALVKAFNADIAKIQSDNF